MIISINQTLNKYFPRPVAISTKQTGKKIDPDIVKRFDELNIYLNSIIKNKGNKNAR